ncbi:MAG: hypothetical protein ACRD02_05020 [Acidimicrobiia bacterium]
MLVVALGVLERGPAEAASAPSPAPGQNWVTPVQAAHPSEVPAPLVNVLDLLPAGLEPDQFQAEVVHDPSVDLVPGVPEE